MAFDLVQKKKPIDELVSLVIFILKLSSFMINKSEVCLEQLCNLISSKLNIMGYKSLWLFAPAMDSLPLYNENK